MPLIALGTDLHPPGYYEAAEVVEIALPLDAHGNPRESPFGPWLRVAYETDWGMVATMMSPAYVEGADLWRLARFCLGDALPEVLDTEALKGCRVPIEVVWGREHGALMAVAHLLVP
jgi:hypothetical protein